MAKIPDSSTKSVHRVVRFDGRTRVVGLRTPGGQWSRVDRVEVFTRAAAARLRAEGYSEVELRRRVARARIPLLWVVGAVAPRDAPSNAPSVAPSNAQRHVPTDAPPAPKSQG